jgi:hypothetical protein
MGREYRGSITTAARKAKGLFMKKHGLVWFGLLAALGALVLAGCPNPNGGSPIVPGSDPAHPVTKTIEAQNISETWGAINSEVLAAKQYVILDLSACTATYNTITGWGSPSENSMDIIKDNPYIKGIILPSSLGRIQTGAFEECKYLTSLSIPAGVTSIGDYVFVGCFSLTRVNIPAGVTTIGHEAFGSCDSLTSITVDGSNANYSSEGGVLFNKEKSVLIKYPGGKGGAYTTIPSSVTTIYGDAFIYDANLTGVSIPANVTNIGSYAFACCAALTSVTFAEGSAIAEAQFSSEQPFDGDLRAKYLAVNGGPGTYTRSGEGTTGSPYVWTKQGA